jgi:sugar transferase EpsL
VNPRVLYSPIILGFQRLVKRVIDLTGSAVGLVVFSPVIGAAAVAVAISMGRPIIYRQLRPGLRGQPFVLYKIRTMRPRIPGDRPSRTEAERLTIVGRFLRRTSIDELPELWNVLLGDMSLVGPRPLLMEYLDRYSPVQARRHEVRPGITGWAQIHGRQELAFRKRFEFDVWYVDHWSLALDLRILAKTFGLVIRSDGIVGGTVDEMPTEESFR